LFLQKFILGASLNLIRTREIYTNPEGDKPYFSIQQPSSSQEAAYSLDINEEPLSLLFSLEDGARLVSTVSEGWLCYFFFEITPFRLHCNSRA